MKSFKCIVIDDDSLIREQIADLIKKHEGIMTLLASCGNGEEGILAIRKHQPDLVFLDIQMPGMTGFEMLQQMPHQNFEIIFVTSYNQYAIKAIKFSALDYLLKPLDQIEFQQAIERFRNRTEHDPVKDRLENLEFNLKENQSNKYRLAIHTKRGTEMIQISEIEVCISESNYTQFELAGGKKFLASKTLSYFEEILGQHEFIRIHRSYLVNINSVRNLKADGTLLLKNGRQLEVSRRKLSEVKSLLSSKS